MVGVKAPWLLGICAACGGPKFVVDRACPAPPALDAGATWDASTPADGGLNDDPGLSDAGWRDWVPESGDGGELEGHRVDVEAVGRLVLFHHTDGRLIARMQDRLSSSLPEGALITLAERDLMTVFDVSGPSTLQVFDDFRQPPRALQTVEFELPEGDSLTRYSVDTGCARKSAEPGLNQVQFSDHCVDERGGELVVVAHEGARPIAYATLKDIQVNGPLDEIVRVELPAWQPMSNEKTFMLTGVPAGSSARVDLTALRGPATLDSHHLVAIWYTGPSVSLSLYDAMPEVGTHWLRSYVVAIDADDKASSQRTENIGHPLPLEGELPFNTLLPVPSVEVDWDQDPPIRWSPSGTDAGVTRVAVTLTWDSEGGGRQWRLWMRPGPTSLRLPTLPSWLAPAALEHVSSVEVRFEKRDDDASWSDVLADLSMPPGAGSAHEAPLGFVSRRTWERSTP
jgi:hypothetical protein